MCRSFTLASLLKERGKIEQQFSEPKDQGLEQPRWYGENRYLLHMETSVFDS